MFSPLFWPIASRQIHFCFGQSTRVYSFRDIRLRHRGRATVLRDEETARSYVLLDDQKSLKLMGNFSLETFQLPSAQGDLPTLMVEKDEQESDSERLRRAVDEAVPSLNVWDAFCPECCQPILKLLSCTKDHRTVATLECSSSMLQVELGNHL